MTNRHFFSDMYPSSRNPFGPSINAIPPLMETCPNFYEHSLHQYSIFQNSSFSNYDYRQRSVFNHSDFSSRDVAAHLSYNHFPVQHQTPLLPLTMPFFDSYSNTEPVNSFYRYDSSMLTSESSSSTDILGEEVMIIDDEDSPSDVSPTFDHHAEESTRNYVERARERLDHHQSIFSLSRLTSPLPKSRSRSPPYRHVVIQSKERIKSSSSSSSLRQSCGRVRKRSQKQRTEDLIYQKHLMRIRQPRLSIESSKHDRVVRCSSENGKNLDEKMAHLFEKYASEDNNIGDQNPWHPLPLGDCQQLYKYALDRYQLQ